MTNVIEQIVRPKSFGMQTIEMNVRSNERGPQGEKGDAGEAATVAAGSAYTLDYGKQPQVINSGTSSDAKFDFYIPEGKPGAIHYYAGPGINITEDNRIEATGEMAVYWGDLVGSINNQTDLSNILNKTVVQNISMTARANNVFITPSRVDILTGIHPGAVSLPIPVASSTSAGIITASDYNQINDNTENIATKLSSANLAVDSTLNKTVTGSGTDTAITLGINTGGVNTSQIADGAVTASKLDLTTVLNLFYPVGTYYETSDTAFDPNVAWGGTWQKDTAGAVTIAQDSGSFDTVGATGGAETHRHDFMIGLHRFCGTMVGDNFDDYSGAYSYSQEKYSKVTNLEAAHTTIRNDALTAGMTSYNESTVTSLGDTDLGSSLPPYVVVIRWHRIA